MDRVGGRDLNGDGGHPQARAGEVAATDYCNVLAEYLVKRAGLASNQLSTAFPGLAPQFVGAFRAT